MMIYTQKTILKKFKRRHFQLLEVLVAVFLLLLCAVPALKIFTGIFKDQVHSAREYERDHLAHLVYAKVVEQFYKRSVPLEDILGGATPTITDPEMSQYLDKLAFGCAITTQVLRQSAPEKELKHYLVSVKVNLIDRSAANTSKEYEYKLYIDQGERDAKGAKPDDKDKKADDKNRIPPPPIPGAGRP